VNEFIEKRKEELLDRAWAKHARIRELLISPKMHRRLDKVTFEFDWSRKRLGCAWNSGKIQMSLGYFLFGNDHVYEEVVIHEIAHVLTPGHWHDEVFKYVFKRLGGRYRIRRYGLNRLTETQKKFLNAKAKLEKLETRTR
jgi:hypothetical protein